MPARRPSLPSLLEQAMGCASSFAEARLAAQRPGWPANPFSKGMHEGSATELILCALYESHPRWLEHWELMQITGRSRGAIAWGLRYMQERGLVRAIKSAKHPQYKRYQVVIVTQEK